jgi:hypothetical protein
MRTVAVLRSICRARLRGGLTVAGYGFRRAVRGDRG